MKAIIYTAIFTCIAQLSYAQASGIDLSKDPEKPATPIYKKSNATLLQEAPTSNTINTEVDLAEQYNSDGTIRSGTYRKASPGNTIITAQPEMMNSTQHQGNIGNLQTTSETYYDNSGKIRSTGTSIKLGK